MSVQLRAGIAAALDVDVIAVSPVTGGDINDSYRAELADGRAVFVKTHPRPLAGMFEREAEGLRWLGEAECLRVPQVLWAGDATGKHPAMLVLEHITPGRLGAERAVALGRGLAELHRFGAPSFGFSSDNFVATVAQDNTEAETWAEFYAERRLRPLVKRAHDLGLVDHGLVGRFESIIARMDDLVGEPEPPARLHGDLWSGNVITDTSGAPVLVDPAVYGGHREVDLAMMELFGGFSEDCLQAYNEVYPLSPGRQQRIPLYHLYPLLVHALLFGRGYLGQLMRALDSVLRIGGAPPLRSA